MSEFVERCRCEKKMAHDAWGSLLAVHWARARRTNATRRTTRVGAVLGSRAFLAAKSD